MEMRVETVGVAVLRCASRYDCSETQKDEDKILVAFIGNQRS